MSDEEELEIWELLHQPLQKENAEKFQKAFKSQEIRSNTEKKVIMETDSKLRKNGFYRNANA